MSEYIKKEDALKAVCKFCPCGDNGLGLSPCRFPEYCISDELNELNGLPTYSFPNSADDNTMEWISAKVGKLFPSNDYKCSKCGNILNFGGVNCGRGDANFCPNCGRKAVNK